MVFRWTCLVKSYALERLAGGRSVRRVVRSIHPPTLAERSVWRSNDWRSTTDRAWLGAYLRLG